MPPADPFARLTWDDVEEWAGHGIVHRGRGYRRDGAVRDLGRTVDGALLAVILTYLDYLKEETPVDTVREDDPRLERLQQGAGMEENFNEDWDEEGWGEDDGDEDDGGEDEEADTRLAATTRRSPGTLSPLRDYLQEHTKAELVSLLEKTAREVPEVRQLLEDRRTFSSGRTRKMIQAVRREIAGLEEPVWDEYEYGYSHGGTVANLDRLQKYLHALADRLQKRLAALEKPGDALTGAGKHQQWEIYLGSLRRENKRRPRCMEMLDRLEGTRKRIVDS